MCEREKGQTYREREREGGGEGKEGERGRHLRTQGTCTHNTG